MSTELEVQLKAGDTVYSEAGQELRFVAHSEVGYICHPVYEVDGRFVNLIACEVHQEVFVRPPVKRYSEECSRLIAQIDKHHRELDSINQSIEEAKKDRDSLMRTLKNYRELTYIESFLEGKITHIVKLSDCGAEIETFDEAMKTGSGNNKHLRLLALYGDSGHTLPYWTISTYGDGSGSLQKVQPCVSLEDAQAYAREYVSNLLDGISNPFIHTDYHIQHVLESALNLGIPLSQEQMKQLSDISIARARRHRDSIAAQYLAAAQRLSEADDQLNSIVFRTTSAGGAQ